jgi:hypothetical protein
MSAVSQPVSDIAVEPANVVVRGNNDWAEVYFKLRPAADFSTVFVSCWLSDETGKPVFQGTSVESNVGANAPYFGKILSRMGVFQGKLTPGCRVERALRPSR